MGGEEDCTWVTSWGFPCFILWCCLSPLSEEFVYLQCSQENKEPAATEESTVEGACLFLLRNSILLCVEWLSFFLSTGSAASQSQSLAPGVQGEGEVGAHVQGEVESLALGGQCLAKFHALGGQGRILFSHFGFTSEV